MMFHETISFLTVKMHMLKPDTIDIKSKRFFHSPTSLLTMSLSITCLSTTGMRVCA